MPAKHGELRGGQQFLINPDTPLRTTERSRQVIPALLRPHSIPYQALPNHDAGGAPARVRARVPRQRPM